MRAAVGEAILTTPTSRLPQLLFDGVEPVQRYWLLVPSSSGYSLVEHETAGPLRRGRPITLDGLDYRVVMVGTSPLHDGRPCAYLEQS